MTGAVFAAGHWRRRDMLEGLTESMLAAIRDAEAGPLKFFEGQYRFVLIGHAPATVRALAERGLLRFSAGPEGAERAYRLTQRGRAVALELKRRAAVRAKLNLARRA